MLPALNRLHRPGAQRLAALAGLIAIVAAPAADARKHPVDRSGKTQTGVASYYGAGDGQAGDKTASGKTMKPSHMTAASPSLPLGTKAKVVNRENGKSANVTITDRGPYAKGRVIDVSPKAAKKLGMKDDGVAPVKVKPVDLPPPKSGP
jgi:rare lipoprotein A